MESEFTEISLHCRFLTVSYEYHVVLKD